MKCYGVATGREQGLCFHCTIYLETDEFNFNFGPDGWRCLTCTSNHMRDKIHGAYILLYAQELHRVTNQGDT